MTEEIDKFVLDTMRSRGGYWAAYENNALDSFQPGHLTFLQFGPSRTFEYPPTRYPDTREIIGWKYVFKGIVELETGRIEEMRVADVPSALNWLTESPLNDTPEQSADRAMVEDGPCEYCGNYCWDLQNGPCIAQKETGTWVRKLKKDGAI